MLNANIVPLRDLVIFIFVLWASYYPHPHSLGLCPFCMTKVSVLLLLGSFRTPLARWLSDEVQDNGLE